MRKKARRDFGGAHGAVGDGDGEAAFDGVDERQLGVEPEEGVGGVEEAGEEGGADDEAPPPRSLAALGMTGGVVRRATRRTMRPAPRALARIESATMPSSGSMPTQANTLSRAM